MKIEAEKLINALHKQQNIFKTLANTDIGLTKVSYIGGHKVAKQCKPFSDGEFEKECLVDIAELLCPNKQLMNIYPVNSSRYLLASVSIAF